MSTQKERDAIARIKNVIWPSKYGVYRRLVKELEELVGIIEAGSRDSTPKYKSGLFDPGWSSNLGGCTARVMPAHF